MGFGRGADYRGLDHSLCVRLALCCATSTSPGDESVLYVYAMHAHMHAYSRRKIGRTVIKGGGRRNKARQSQRKCRVCAGSQR